MAWMARMVALLAAGLALALSVAGSAARVQTAERPPRAVATLESGLWELKTVGEDGELVRICAGDLRLLLQPMHSQPLCRQFFNDEYDDRVTVSYDCAARGQGRTSLRVETPRLVQIDTGGVVGGRPFTTRLEGRRIGTCRPAR